MKKIEAIIRTEKLDIVMEALEREGYPGVTITDVRGHGKQRGARDEWHGQYQPKTFTNKTKIEIITHDADMNRIVNAIVTTARTQGFGDGKIFVSNIEDAIRIRTTQRGDVALD